MMTLEQAIRKQGLDPKSGYKPKVLGRQQGKGPNTKLMEKVKAYRQVCPDSPLYMTEPLLAALVRQNGGNWFPLDDFMREERVVIIDPENP